MNLEPPPDYRLLLADNERLHRIYREPHKYDFLTKSYYPFRKLKHVAREAGVDPEDAWVLAKLGRTKNFLTLFPAEDRATPFWWHPGNHLLEPLHRIDRAVGGGGPASFEPERGVLASEEHRQRLRIRTLMDEAAESSLIEGAATTRREAVNLLRENRAPRTRGERMIVNNYVAMEQIKRWLDRPLTPEMLLELQTILTKDTLDNPADVGRWRRPGENVRVVDERSADVIYTPPDAADLAARINALCAFANATHAGERFIHPVIKASILHFMIGYEHPFPDGNGRTARAVFYWYALRAGYSLFEYIPISERIRAGYARYPQAYIDTELDEGDLTYFILYKLDIIEQSLDRFSSRLAHEEEKVRRSERLLRLARNLNLRQRLLLEHALRHPRTLYTRQSHARSNGIALSTAISDLDDLVRKRLLIRGKRGKQMTYNVVPDLRARLERRRP
jgi:Fic family protein